MLNNQPQGASIEAALLNIGNQMANVMFNLAQRPGEPLTGDVVATMDKLRKQWDAARRTPAAATGDGELPPLLTDSQIEALWARHADTAKPGERRIAFGRAVERAAIAADRQGYVGAAFDAMHKMQATIDDLRAQLAAKGQGEPMAWITFRTKDGRERLTDGCIASNRAYIEAHNKWVWEPLGRIAAPASAQPAEHITPELLSKLDQIVARAEHLSAPVEALKRKYGAAGEQPADPEQFFALHRQVAAEKLRADQGWQRAEAKSQECIELRERMAGAQPDQWESAAEVRAAALEEAARVVLDGNYWNGAPADVYETAVDRAAAIRALAASPAAQPAKDEPGPWQVLGMQDMPDADRKLDVVLTNGVIEENRSYSQIDWTQVADWRYSQDSANNGADEQKGGA